MELQIILWLEKCFLESNFLEVNLVKTKVMVCKIRQINVKLFSMKDLCGISGRKTMANAVLYKSYWNWIYGWCTKIKMVTNCFAIDFWCMNCNGCHENVEDEEEKLHDVETVTHFSYLGDRTDSGGGCEVAVISRTRLGWVKFRECQDLLCRRISSKNTSAVWVQQCFMKARHNA